MSSLKKTNFIKWKSWFESKLEEYDRAQLTMTALEHELLAACVKISQVRLLNGEQNFCDETVRSTELPQELVEYWFRLVTNKTIIARPHYPEGRPATQWDLIHVVAHQWYKLER